MADLKPIGSEKLKGEKKLKRIMEIANFNRNFNSEVGDPLKTEFYKVRLPDGFDYRIILEKNGYIIQKGLNDTYNYLDRIENLRYSKAYSSAFSRLNLITKEINEAFGNKDGINLFEQKKYVLKTPTSSKIENEQSNHEEGGLAPIQPSPKMSSTNELPAQLPVPDNETPPPVDVNLENSSEVKDDIEDSNEVSFKQIQKITGRLAQKIREFENSSEFTSKDMKYVINSILSAMSLSNLNEEDLEQILKRFDSGEENKMDSNPDKEGENVPLGENSNDFEFTDDLMDSIFSESKVDKVLSKYFTKNKKSPVIKNNNISKLNKTIDLIETSSINDKQRIEALRFMKKNYSGKFKGKTNKNNLIFEVKNRLYKITPKGEVL